MYLPFIKCLRMCQALNYLNTLGGKKKVLIKRKTDKLYLIKMKNFCSLKDNVKKMKTSHRWGKTI